MIIRIPSDLETRVQKLDNCFSFTLLSKDDERLEFEIVFDPLSRRIDPNIRGRYLMIVYANKDVELRHYSDGINGRKLVSRKFRFDDLRKASDEVYKFVFRKYYNGLDLNRL